MGKRLVDDPCIKVCKFEHGVCRGCRRTRDEVKGWKAMTRGQRAAVILRMGPPPARRDKKLRKLDRRIAKLEARLAELRRKRAKAEMKAGLAGEPVS